MANAYAASGDFKNAEAMVRRIDAEMPQYQKSRIFLATLQRQQGRIDHAIATIEEVEDAVPFDSQLELYRASLYKEKNDKRKVRSILEKLFEKQEPNDRLLFDYAVILHDLGDVPETITALRKAIALNSSNIEALNFLAYELAKSSASQAELIEAQGLIKKALVLRPKDGYILDTAAWIAFKLNNTGEAQKLIRQALSFTPEDSVILEHAAIIEKSGGELEQSTKHCQAAIAIEPKDSEAQSAIDDCKKLLGL